MKNRKNVISALLFLAVVRVSSASGSDSEAFELLPQMGHAGRINDLEFFGDDRFLITAGQDDSVKIWDVESGLLVKNLRFDADQVASIDVSADGEKALLASLDGRLFQADLEPEVALREGSAEWLGDPSDDVEEVRYTESGRSAVTVSWKGSIGLWDVSDDIVLREEFSVKDLLESARIPPEDFEGPGTPVSVVSCADIAVDGTKVLIGTTYSGVVLFDLATGEERRLSGCERGSADHVEFSKDGTAALVCLRSPKEIHKTGIWDVSSGRLSVEIPIASGDVTYAASLRWSPDGKSVVFTDSRNDRETAVFYDAATGRETERLVLDDLEMRCRISDSGKLAATYDDIGTSPVRIRVYPTFDTVGVVGKRSVYSALSADVSGDGRYLAAMSLFGEAVVWDLHAGSPAADLGKGNAGRNGAVAIHPEGNCVLTDEGSKFYDDPESEQGIIDWGEYALYDLETGEKRWTQGIENYSGSDSTTFSSDGSFFLKTIGNSDFALIGSTDTGEIRRILRSPNEYVGKGDLSPDDRYAAVGGWNLKIWDTGTGDLIRRLDCEGVVTTVDYSEDGKTILIETTENVVKLLDSEDLSTSLEIRIPKTARISAAALGPGDAPVAIAVDDGSIRLHSRIDGSELRVIEGPPKWHSDLLYSPDGTKLITAGDDGWTTIHDLEDGGFVNVIFSEGDWLIITHDGYWDGSANAGDLVAMTDGKRAWRIDQFAIRNNRPDIVLERLGSPEADRIDYYRNLYLRRLRKAGLSERGRNGIGTDRLPDTEISDYSRSGKFVTIDFRLSGRGAGLAAYQVHVNDVPLYPGLGKSVGGRSYEGSERIELVRGTNKIEISCSSDEGLESLRAAHYTSYSGDAVGKLFFLGFGVSDYARNDLDLRFAAKDAEDLAAAFSRVGGFEDRIVRSYVDGEVDAGNLSEARRLLESAGADDTVVLFISGHGLHDTDDEATYYYLTRNSDPYDPAGTAIPFREFEELLQGIAPRRKLFLMDTCGSGEVDPGIFENAGAQGAIRTEAGEGVASRGLGIATHRRRTREYLNEQGRFITNDLFRRTGAVVFSSCRGEEVSYETEEIGNGVFSEYIVKALHGSCDADGDGLLDIRELQSFVTEGVAAFTDPSMGFPSTQHPTVDRDNLSLELSFLPLPSESFLAGHERSAFFVDAARNTNIAASCALDGTVIVWDIAENEPVKRLEGHGKAITAIAVSPDGSLVFTAGKDGVFSLHDLRSVGETRMPPESFPDTYAAVFSSSGRALFTGSEDGTARMWSVPDMTLVTEFVQEEGSVDSLDVSPNGRLLATGSSDGRVHLWNVGSGSLIRTYSGHDGAVYGTAFSPDGQTIATSAAGGGIKKWGFDGSDPVLTIKTRTSDIPEVAFTPDGTKLISCSMQGEAAVWNAETGELLRSRNFNKGYLTDVAIDGEGLYAVFGGETESPILWYFGD